MKHKVVKKGDAYKIDGDTVSKNKKFCPKCGPGVFMADHGTRIHCGRCGYTEFTTSKIEKKPAPKQTQETTKPAQVAEKPATETKKPADEPKKPAKETMESASKEKTPKK